LPLAATPTGNVRSENQDVIVERPDLGLYAVLDGMGGGPAGEVDTARWARPSSRASWRGRGRP
jgi:serine/threonine protein phosphatase PrpC